MILTIISDYITIDYTGGQLCIGIGGMLNLDQLSLEIGPYAIRLFPSYFP